MSPDQGPGVNTETDLRLIAEIAAGSAEGLGRLYDRYGAVVYGLACRITRQAADAEEVVQDVFAQLWRQAPRYDAARGTVAAWLVMVTRARALDRLRGRRARPDLDAAVPPDAAPALVADAPSPEQAAIAATEIGRVRDALVTLPAAQRTLVEMAYYEGLTHAEISARTGTPLGTVKTRLRAAAATLRGALSS